ncbi:uncharacterized protein KY384_001724 [Bacidia gigantensis]|uniref:uncharacterized protein n=1 Tax=Bacidia gigantensis TaxID=2732470 RepID=UPI001D0586D9|nr:uncharacterized protein KY384_001724 [Bacidia gigantensis]KAG8533981.1 hypothetical protein KY384_001724 [Bacidia gigantensis]
MDKLSPHYDVIIIGAGPQGLSAAKSFLQLNPTLKLRIIDSNESIGGVWRKENLYPGLRLNNIRHGFEFSDFPFSDEYGVKQRDHVTGTAMHQYLNDYAAKYDLQRITTLCTKVTRVEKSESGWAVTVSSSNATGNSPSEKSIQCSKLIIATGLTSSPAPIGLKYDSNFQPPIINFKDLAKESSGVLRDETTEHVTVVGGGKGAYDSVYLLATRGKKVAWIIRSSGHGPIWMAPSHVQIGPVLCWLEKLATTRFITFFSPSIWGDADGFGWIRSLLHGTRFGRWLVKGFYGKLSYETLLQSGLLKDEKLKVLIPDDNALWYGAGLSILNYPTDIHDFVLSGQVEVIRKDIDTLRAPNKVHFANSDHAPLETDAVICNTGWKHDLPFEVLPHSLHSDLGLPTTHMTDSEMESWADMDAQADAEVFQRFPMLKAGPRLENPQMQTQQRPSPWRLWRGIAPPGLVNAPPEDRSIVFLGMMVFLQTSLRCELCSLWAYAWMMGCMNLSKAFSLASASKTPVDLRRQINGTKDSSKNQSQDSAKSDSFFYEAALQQRFFKWRAPYSYGSLYPDFAFDGIPYFDMLLRDMGLRHWRKGWSWIGELFTGGGYLAPDYRGVVEEWREKNSDGHDISNNSSKLLNGDRSDVDAQAYKDK